MNRRVFLAQLGLAIPAWPSAQAAVSAGDSSIAQPRELIGDPTFRRGFLLLDPQPGQRVVRGDLPGTPVGAKPVWDLAQWSSRFPLSAAAPAHPTTDTRRWSNAAKAVTLGEPGTPAADLALAVNAIVEYGAKARTGSEPWVHLLVQQEFEAPPALGELTSARLRIDARLTRSTLFQTDDYSPDRHAAQFQLFFTIQNRNRESPGYGKFLWFGIPLYDDRSRFPKEHKQQDTAGSEMFIYTPGGEVFSERSAHEREWIHVDKNLLPRFREALEAAWQRGFLTASRELRDYQVTGMNLGWEVPGLFDVEMQVRHLSLQVQSG